VAGGGLVEYHLTLPKLTLWIATLVSGRWVIFVFLFSRGTAVTHPNAADQEGAQVTADTTTPPAPPPTASEERSPATAPPDAGTPARSGPAGEDTIVAASSAAPEHAVPGGTPAAHTLEERQQRAHLLQQVKDSGSGKLTKGKANRFPRIVTRELNLTSAVANAVREQLVQEGYLQVARKGGSEVFELTEAGQTYLQTLEHKPLPTGKRGAEHEAEVSEEVRKYRRTFLLFQLFEAEGQTLDQTAVNRFREPGRKCLDLKAAVANTFRGQMIEEGLIEEQRQGRNVTYTLTPAGREELGAAASFPDVEMVINGRVLNELLEVAREAARQFQPSESEPEPAHRPEVPVEVG
jgi:predicted transcriptional regulator